MSASEWRPDGAPSESPARATEGTLTSATDSGLRIPDVSDMDALSAALAYAQAGWYVLPVKKGSKHPGSVVGNRWHLLSSCEPDVIVSWFAGTDHGVALHLGRSGAVAFHVDDAMRMPEVLARAIVLANPPRQSTRRGMQAGHTTCLRSASDA